MPPAQEWWESVKPKGGQLDNQFSLGTAFTLLGGCPRAPFCTCAQEGGEG